MSAKERQAHRLLAAIFAAGEGDAIDAVTVMLRATLNGAVALRHLRMFPRLAAEAVAHGLLRKEIVPKKGRNGK